MVAYVARPPGRGGLGEEKKEGVPLPMEIRRNAEEGNRRGCAVNQKKIF